MTEMKDIFTDEVLRGLFPPERANAFFDALFGDASEGAYDISVTFNNQLPGSKELYFNLNLTQRPGKCLACNLTYGLPEVFSRHPIINIKGLVADIEKVLNGPKCAQWKLKHTKSLSSALHIIPLVITLE